MITNHLFIKPTDISIAQICWFCLTIHSRVDKKAVNPALRQTGSAINTRDTCSIISKWSCVLPSVCCSRMFFHRGARMVNPPCYVSRDCKLCLIAHQHRSICRALTSCQYANFITRSAIAALHCVFFPPDVHVKSS